MEHAVIINRYALSMSGLSVTYTYKGQTKTRNYCPLATCDLLKSFGLIESFDRDINQEPVILYTQCNRGRPATGWAMWYLFARNFPLAEKALAIIMDRIESSRESGYFQASIDRMLRPLRYAA